MDTNSIRHDFSLLRNTDPLVYFDNACATLKPDSVLEAMDRYNREFPTCGGRSINRLGEMVTKAVYSARSTVAKFIKARQVEEIVFVRNTSEGLNLLSRTLELSAGDTILTGDKEHNSNLVPWQLAAQRTGAVHKIVSTKADGQFDLYAYETALKEGGVKVVALSLVSNLDGVTIPAQEIVALAHEYGALVVLDAAQAAPHQVIDVQILDVDFLVFSGHKLCGPSGTGVLYGKHAMLEKLEPFLVGGSTVNATSYESYELLPTPEKFEAGTQDYAGIIGLEAAVQYIESIGREEIRRHEHKLNAYATEQLQTIPDVHIIGPHDPALRSGILSFYIDGIDIHQIALALDSGSGVQVRSGQHCVHSWFAARDIFGSVRLSFYVYNTIEEIDQCIEGLEKIRTVYGT